TKFNAAGTALDYSTYIGGMGTDTESGIAVDGSGNAYFTGWTTQAMMNAFPVTTGAFQTNFGGGGSDAVVTQLNRSGNALSYSTFLGGGGNDQGYAIAVDGSGNAYVTGSTASSNFPTTSGAYQTSNGGGTGTDAFVVKFNSSGSALSFGTYVGGSGDDFGRA